MDMQVPSTVLESLARKPLREDYKEVRVRTDPELNRQAREILASLDLNLNTAVRLFLKEIVKYKCLPFTPTTAVEDALVPVPKPLSFPSIDFPPLED